MPRRTARSTTESSALQCYAESSTSCLHARWQGAPHILSAHPTRLSRTWNVSGSGFDPQAPAHDSTDPGPVCEATCSHSAEQTGSPSAASRSLPSLAP
eukprot:767586-Hanusia_phi.AAC.4